MCPEAAIHAKPSTLPPRLSVPRHQVCLQRGCLDGREAGPAVPPANVDSGKKIISKSDKFTKIENSYSGRGALVPAHGAGQGRSSGLAMASSSRCSGRWPTTTSRRQPTKPVP